MSGLQAAEAQAHDVLERCQALADQLLQHVHASHPAAQVRPEMGKKRKRSSPSPGTKHKSVEKQLLMPGTPTLELLPGCKGELRHFQLQGVRWLASMHMSGLSCILSDERASDRRGQVGGMVSFLQSRGNCGPFLIVAPSSHHSAWLGELHGLLGSNVIVHSLHGQIITKEVLHSIHTASATPQAPPSQALPPSLVVLATPEQVQADRPLSQAGFKYLVLDLGCPEDSLPAFQAGALTQDTRQPSSGPQSSPSPHPQPPSQLQASGCPAPHLAASSPCWHSSPLRSQASDPSSGPWGGPTALRSPGTHQDLPKPPQQQWPPPLQQQQQRLGMLGSRRSSTELTGPAYDGSTMASAELPGGLFANSSATASLQPQLLSTGICSAPFISLAAPASAQPYLYQLNPSPFYAIAASGPQGKPPLAPSWQPAQPQQVVSQSSMATHTQASPGHPDLPHAASSQQGALTPSARSGSGALGQPSGSVRTPQPVPAPAAVSLNLDLVAAITEAKAPSASVLLLTGPNLEACCSLEAVTALLSLLLPDAAPSLQSAITQLELSLTPGPHSGLPTCKYFPHPSLPQPIQGCHQAVSAWCPEQHTAGQAGAQLGHGVDGVAWCAAATSPGLHRARTPPPSLPSPDALTTGHHAAGQPALEGLLQRMRALASRFSLCRMAEAVELSALRGQSTEVNLYDLFASAS
ncbi:hypothetical protein V8C86DRAFT_2585256 [Haematococcus lacustris]